MEFEYLLFQAQSGDEIAERKIVEMYRPLVVKYSVVNGIFDEDLFQELNVEVVRCIRNYRVLN